ncbi:hypothetical protein AVEN_175492-1 [Araneus ventricosus]|uniref:Transposase Tc1-like domain-containing protein n=1 Tax=Araneus ventricosus TaxID=182803 RepID=A0A4Y2NNW5_ARAVE|nr:hypothetical protein AVEN_175492-1 [Araneus ventricosus]
MILTDFLPQFYQGRVCKYASRQTVSRRLHKGGLFTRRSVVCVPLSPEHVRARLHWVHEHRSWTPEQWGNVLFTDESRFNIQNDSRRATIWRESGIRKRPC